MRFTKQLLAGLLASAMLPAAVPAFAAEGRTNIALGKSYTIESDAPNENSLGTTEEGGKDQLTDGAYGTSEYYSGLWAHFVNAYGRTVTIDSLLDEEGYAAVFKDFGYKGSDYRLKRSAETASHYTLGQLETCLQVLLDLDKSLKSQPVDVQTLLEAALCRLALAGSGR